MPSSRAIRYAEPSSGPSPTSSSRAGTLRRMRSKIASTASIRLTGRKFDTCTTILVVGSPPVNRWRRSGLGTRRWIAQSRKFGMTSMARFTPSSRVRRVSQALRYGGHAVRLLDRERDDLRVRRVAPDERDVGPVQRRHHARDSTVPGRGQHLLRQERRRRVRNGVVRVDDVEARTRARPARSCWRATTGTAAPGRADRSA